MRPQRYDDAALGAARSGCFGRMRTKLLTDAAALGFAVVDLEGAFRGAFVKDGLRLNLSSICIGTRTGTQSSLLP